MKIYSKLFLSIFLLFPYLVIQNKFYSYSYLFLSKIFKKEINEKIFLLLMLCYFILFFFILIISFFKILLFEIIAGILIIVSTIDNTLKMLISDKNFDCRFYFELLIGQRLYSEPFQQPKIFVERNIV